MIQKPQTTQNFALHVATDCVKRTSIDHLHEETKMLSFDNHLSLLGSQYVARTLQPNNHSLNNQPNQPPT